jgi:hypothetical protein
MSKKESCCRDIKQVQEDFILSLACKSKQTTTRISLQLVLQIKGPQREAANHQRYIPKMKDQPAATALTLRIAAV